MNKEILKESRKVIGNYLKETRKEKKISLYKCSKLSGLSIGQINSIEKGEKDYTFSSFLRIINSLDCYFFLKDKENEHLNFSHMLEKLNEN
jgi:transcriptional regulator with XRE-family HTH domain